MKKLLWIIGVLAVVVSLALGYARFAPRQTPPGQPPLARLTPETFGDLQRQFNDAAGQVRVLVLLSPT